MRRFKVKICGITNPADAALAARLGADALGFVMAPRSPRQVEPEAAARILGTLPPWTVPVAVTVDPADDLLDRIRNAGFSWVQLSGDESPDRIVSIRNRFPFHVIKTMHVRSAEDLEPAGAYVDHADLFLLDTRTAASKGGSGLRFDWSLLTGWRWGPFLLAGGLDPDAVALAVSTIDHPDLFGFDVSSRLESEPGRKDPGLLRRFFANLYAETEDRRRREARRGTR